MVEMAILAPLLLFLLLGLFEVGKALKVYADLVWLSRDIARWASRPGYFDNGDFTPVDDKLKTESEFVGGLDILNKGGLILTFIRPNTDTIMSCNYDVNENGERVRPGPKCVIRSESGITYTNHLWPDDKDECINNGNYWDYWPGCDCDMIAQMTYTSTITQYATGIYTKPVRDYEVIADQVERLNVVYNCNRFKQYLTFAPVSNNQVVAELHYDSDQLFGLPLFPDPIHMWTFSVFRKLDNTR